VDGLENRGKKKRKKYDKKENKIERDVEN